MMAIIIWNFVVMKRQTNQGSIAFLVTFGLVIPISILLPIHLVKSLNIQNGVLIIVFAASSPLIILRCLEALFGTSRAYVEKHLSQFLLYHVSPVSFVFDSKTENVQHATWDGISSKLIKLLPGLVETTILLNIILANVHTPFPTLKHDSPGETPSIWHLFYWGNLLNNFVLAYLTEMYLEFGTRSAAIVISLLSGLETIEVNDSPLSLSTSVSEFWGRRWNRLVGGLLKVGIFKPICQQFGSSKLFAILATFFASGLLHECILAIVTYGTDTQYEPHYFFQTSFFMWNGVMLILEGLLSSKIDLQRISCEVPSRLKNMCVLMTTIPVAHWFLDEFVGLKIFQHFAVAFPKVRMR